MRSRNAPRGLRPETFTAARQLNINFSDQHFFAAHLTSLFYAILFLNDKDQKEIATHHLTDSDDRATLSKTNVDEHSAFCVKATKIHE